MNTDAEYEKEGGAWRWSIDVKENGKIHNIGVDAMTGKIVENGWEATSNSHLARGRCAAL